MNPNVLPSDRIAVAGVIDPDAYAASTVTSAWIAMSVFDNIMAVIQAGTLGASATLDAKLEQASDDTGTGAKDITGKAITQLTQAGADSDKQAIINCRSDELDLENSFTHVRLSMTIGTANSDAGAIVLGMDARYQPADQAASIDEVVA